MKRRDMLKVTGVTLTGLSAFPMAWVRGSDTKKQRVLYFTRSAGFEHGAVKRKGSELSFSEKTLVSLGAAHGFDVECTKDGRIFDGDLGKYDLIAFYTSGDLTKPNKQKTPPMSAAGKKRLLEAIAAGRGFVGFHAATDSFHSRGGKIDPYIAMLGGEFVTHGAQQAAKITVTSPSFPGAEKLAPATELKEEWYAQKNFPKDLHVILVQETEGMQGKCYARPSFPATWARMHGKGRVFYTSFGHRDDIWTNPKVQALILGGFAWAMKNVSADVTPNFEKVTPKANELPA